MRKIDRKLNGRLGYVWIGFVFGFLAGFWVYWGFNKLQEVLHG